VTGELSRGNELLNAFRDESGWLQIFQDDILQDGQELHHTFSNKALQDERNMWRNFWGQVEILHGGKWL
jgi:hypothetical protein